MPLLLYSNWSQIKDKVRKSSHMYNKVNEIVKTRRQRCRKHVNVQRRLQVLYVTFLAKNSIYLVDIKIRPRMFLKC